MTTSYPFIQSLQINNVRHLKDLYIEIDKERPRHLILTGPNGCGKTSVLWFLKNYLSGVPTKKILSTDKWKKEIAQQESQIVELQQKQKKTSNENEKAQIQQKIITAERNIANRKEEMSSFSAIVPQIFNLTELVRSYPEGKVVIAFFGAKRTSNIATVRGVQKLELRKVNSIEATGKNSLSSRFLQYLVNQENRAAMLQRMGDTKGVEEIEEWMRNLTSRFRSLFQNEALELKYDIDDMNFQIHIPGREPFGFVDNQLSDGFSAVIQIIAELLLRM